MAKGGRDGMMLRGDKVRILKVNFLGLGLIFCVAVGSYPSPALFSKDESILWVEFKGSGRFRSLNGFLILYTLFLLVYNPMTGLWS